MRFKLIGAATFASLAVLTMVDTGGALAAGRCSFSDRTSVFGGGCLDTSGYGDESRRDYANYHPDSQPEEVGTQDEAERNGDREDRRHGYHHRHDRDQHRHHAHPDRHQAGHGWRDRDFDLDDVDLGSLVREGFRGGFKIGYVVAKKGWEDQIDPDILENLRNGPLSKTDFAKGVEKGYEAGKNGHGRRDHGGHRGHWGGKDRHHAHNGHHGKGHGHDRGHHGKGHGHDRGHHGKGHGHDRGHGKGHDRGHGGHDRGHGKGHDRGHGHR